MHAATAAVFRQSDRLEFPLGCRHASLPGHRRRQHAGGRPVEHWHATRSVGRPEIGGQFELNRFLRDWHRRHPGGSPVDARAAWRLHRRQPVDARPDAVDEAGTTGAAIERYWPDAGFLFLTLAAGAAPRRQPRVDPEGQGEWDERYAGAERMWSGQPNGALVAEIRDLPPGRVLDVGCGEGGDAVWLARQGWDVTALDVSQVALDRAERAAEAAGVKVRWLHAGLLDAGLGADEIRSGVGAVSRPPPDARPPSRTDPAGRRWTRRNAVGGPSRRPRLSAGPEQGFDPADYVAHEDLVALVRDGWRVESDDRRPRVVRGGSGEHHKDDLVLRARRTL